MLNVNIGVDGMAIPSSPQLISRCGRVIKGFSLPVCLTNEEIQEAHLLQKRMFCGDEQAIFSFEKFCKAQGLVFYFVDEQGVVHFKAKEVVL
jgi:hypothetical protein